MQRFAIAGLSLVAIVVCAGMWLTDNLPQAHAASDPKLKFDAGIGFYLISKKSSLPVSLLIASLELNDTRLRGAPMPVPADSEMYVYGFDFSQASGAGYAPMHPSSIGYAFSYIKSDNSSSELYSVAFVPIEGYDQPVYRISWPPNQEKFIRTQRAENLYWSFHVPASTKRNARAYNFVFQDK